MDNKQSRAPKSLSYFSQSSQCPAGLIGSINIGQVLSTLLKVNEKQLPGLLGIVSLG